MIYLDAGATTLQKPERVRRAMYNAVAAMSSPGRGGYPATRLAEETDFSAAVWRRSCLTWTIPRRWCSPATPLTG